MVENNAGIVASLVAYMAVCLLLGFIAYRRTSTLGDFILGGRKLGSWVTALSAQASDMSGWLLMGLPGLAYLSGFDAIWLAAGLVAGTWANWRFIAARLRARTEQLADSATPRDCCARFRPPSSSYSSLSIPVPASSPPASCSRRCSACPTSKPCSGARS
jgi:sodium/proline symporter